MQQLRQKRTTLIANIYLFQNTIVRQTDWNHRDLPCQWSSIYPMRLNIWIEMVWLPLAWHCGSKKERTKSKTNWPFWYQRVCCLLCLMFLLLFGGYVSILCGLWMRQKADAGREERLWRDGTKSKSVTDVKPLSSSWLNYSFILPQYRYRSGRCALLGWLAGYCCCCCCNFFFLCWIIFSPLATGMKIFDAPSVALDKGWKLSSRENEFSAGALFFCRRCCAMRIQLFYVVWPLAIFNLLLSTVSLWWGRVVPRVSVLLAKLGFSRLMWIVLAFALT